MAERHYHQCGHAPPARTRPQQGQPSTIGDAATALLRGLTGSRSGAVVQLVASGGGGLYTVTDQVGYNAAPSTAILPAPFVALPANTSFRGVAFTPVATALAATHPRPRPK